MLRCSRMLVVLLAGWLVMGGSARAQVQVEADTLIMKRRDSGSGSFITGPEGVSGGDEFGYATGFRVGVVGGYDWLEVEALFSQIDDWTNKENRILDSGLSFDDSSGNPLIFPGGAANVIAFRNALFEAATSPGAVGEDETLEGELLQPGARALVRSSSRYTDFELNFNNNRTLSKYRFGLGWRSIRLKDRTRFGAIGTFDAIDIDDGAVDGDAGNDENDGLSDAALVAAGFQVAAGGADGFNAADVVGAGPDTLAVVYDGVADNELNGLQAIAAAQLTETEYFILEVVGKAGVYHNRVHANTRELLAGSGNDDSIYSRTFTDSTSNASFVGSLGLQARVPVTDYITFTTGYEGTLLTGVAVGSSQMSGVHQDIFGDTVYTAQADDNALLHGAKFGLEVTF